MIKAKRKYNIQPAFPLSAFITITNLSKKRK